MTQRKALTVPPEPSQAGEAVGIGQLVVVQHQGLQGWEPQDVLLAYQLCHRGLPVGTEILGTEQG